MSFLVWVAVLYLGWLDFLGVCPGGASRIALGGVPGEAGFGGFPPSLDDPVLMW